MTPKQERFVQEYLVDRNASQAAIRAGYSGATAGSIGHALLKNVAVAQALRLAGEEITQRIEITQEMVLDGLHHEATLKGKGSSPSARVTAWSLLGKHLSLFSDRLDITGKLTLEQLVLQAAAKINPEKKD